VVLGVGLWFVPFKSEASEKKWFVSLYGAQADENRLNRIMRFKSDPIDYYLACVAVGKEFYDFRGLFSLEWELQLAHHFNHQTYEEVNGLFVFRWLKFPWDAYLDTSLGLGEGLSYATEESELEALQHEKTTRFLNYLKLDMDFNLPAYPAWALFFQIYHRSGMFGTFDGVSGASEFLGWGVKYRF
jgi:hypothetical protein